MLQLLAAILAQNGGASPAAAPTTPTAPTVLSAVTTGVAGSSLASTSFSPTAGGLLIAVYTTRDNNDATHNDPTASGLSNIGTWSKVTTSRVQTAGSNRWLRQTTFWAQVGSSPGTGTLTASASESVFTQGWVIYEITGGFNANAPVKQSKAASDEAVTTLTVTLDAAADADSSLFGALLLEGTDSASITVPTGFTQLDRITGASCDRSYSYDLAGGATANQWTSLDNDSGDVVIAHVLEIDANSVPPLVDPTFLDDVIVTSTAATATTPSLSPASDALYLVVMRTRGSAVITHNTPTTTLAGLGAFTSIDTVGMTGVTDSSRWHRISAWWAKGTGAPGSGTITCTTSGNFFSCKLEVYQVASGYNAASPIGTKNTASNESGTTVSLTLPDTPAADSFVFSALQQGGTSAGISPSTNFTELVDEQAGSSIHAQSQYDRTSPGTGVSLSGLITDKPHLLLAFEVKAAVT